MKSEELDFTSEFECVVNESFSGLHHAFVLYFDIDFLKDCTSPVFFSTGPFVEPTHWMQTLLYVENATDTLAAGDVVVGTISCCKSRAYHRDLTIKIQYEVRGKSERKTLEYILQ